MLKNLRLGGVDISLVWVSVLDEFGVGESLGHVRCFLRPLLKVTSVELALVDGVCLRECLCFIGVPVPIFVRKWKFRIASIRIENGVPDCVQIAYTALSWDMLEVTTSITLRVLRVNEFCGVEWLMNITEVVDDQADGHRSLIFHIVELVSNFRNVVG